MIQCKDAHIQPISTGEEVDVLVQKHECFVQNLLVNGTRKAHCRVFMCEEQVKYSIQKHIVDICGEELLSVRKDLRFLPHDDIVQRDDLKCREVEATTVPVYE